MKTSKAPKWARGSLIWKMSLADRPAALDEAEEQLRTVRNLTDGAVRQIVFLSGAVGVDEFGRQIDKVRLLAKVFHVGDQPPRAGEVVGFEGVGVHAGAGVAAVGHEHHVLFQRRQRLQVDHKVRQQLPLYLSLIHELILENLLL